MSTSAQLDLALDLAKKSGVIFRKNFTLNMEKDWKDDNSPVTVTDIAINELIVSVVSEAYPEHSILSEEEETDMHFSRDSEFVWICDPVDGTHNFAHGIPTATFALALTKNGVPELGVIYDPFLDRIFYAERGTGAFMNGESIHVSTIPTLKRTMIGMGKMKGVIDLFPVMEASYDFGAKIITGLSTHYMTALVAAGEFSASFFGGTSAHDMTAGKIIVEEAGGKATNLFGNVSERFDRDQEGQLCSNGVVHDELLSIMKRVTS